MPATAERIGPYLDQLLDNDDVQANVRRAVTRAEQAYARARDRKDTKEALKDRAVQRRVQDGVVAARDAVVAIRRGPEIQRAQERNRRRRRRRNRLLGVAALAGGAYAAYKASTPSDKEQANV